MFLNKLPHMSPIVNTLPSANVTATSNSLFCICSPIALAAFKSYLTQLSPQMKDAVFAISTISCDLHDDLSDCQILRLQINHDNLLCNYIDWKKLVIEFLKPLAIQKVVFYDFAKDLRCFILAKIFICLDFRILVLPVIPYPSIPLNISDIFPRILTNPRLTFYLIYFSVLQFPVSLFSFSRDIRGDNIKYFRLFHPKILYRTYQPLYQQPASYKLPPEIRYLYIEGCDSSLSKESYDTLNKLLEDVSLFLKSNGETLYIKPRDRNQLNIIKPIGSQPYIGPLCQDIDMNECVLLTIASSGALCKTHSKVISLAQILLEQCSFVPNDSQILSNQLDYAQSFNHPLLLFPLTIDLLLSYLRS